MKRWWFLAAGSACAVIAVSSPVDALADRSFAWHMVQHLALCLIAPVLLLLGRPLQLFVRRVPKAAVRSVAVLSRAVRIVTYPAIALPAFVFTLWVVHFSPLYERALEAPIVHVGEHALLFGAGLLFWFCVVEPFDAPPSLGPPARAFYLFVALPQCALVGVAIDSARRPLYAHYVRALGSAALHDQHDAAAIMWLGSGTVVFAAILLVLAGWARREMREDRVEWSH